MAAEKSDPKAKDSPVETELADKGSPGRKGGLWRALLRNWVLLVLLIATIAVQGTAFLYHHAANRIPAPPPAAEIDLGVFRFEADRTDGGQAFLQADFALHVGLQEAAERVARPRLAARKFRVQQDIEELLRKAHAGDFDDPALQDLKRQLLEQIDQTLGVRAVSEVIITGLKLQRGKLPQAQVASTAESR
jgi:hypothetical protein